MLDPNAPAPDTADELFRTMYQDLRRLASSRLRRSENITMLDTTALVHESYMRFQHQSDLGGMTQGQFLAYAARVMRFVVIDLARSGRVWIDLALIVEEMVDDVDPIGLHMTVMVIQMIDDRIRYAEPTFVNLAP